MNLLILLLVLVLFFGAGSGYYGAWPAPWAATAPNHYVGGGISIFGILIFLILLRVFGII